MQNSWRIIDCSQVVGVLRYERGRLVVIQRDEEGTEESSKIPLADVAVLLIGLRVSCSAALLHQLAQYGVSVMICDWRCVPVAALHSWSDTPTQVTKRYRAQVGMSEPRKKNAWQQVTKAKILGQANCLDYLGKPGAAALRNIAKATKSGDPSNTEGQAARAYWGYLFSSRESFSRIPGAGYGRHAQFDYAYSVLRGFAVKAVIAAGLAPPIGINHHNRSNYFCLADDLIEPFRPAIDAKVAQLSSEDSLEDKDVKSYLVDAVNQQFGSSGLTIPSELNNLAQQFGLYAEGNMSRLPVNVFEVLDED